MAAKGDMSYVWAKDKEILRKESVEAVTALLKYARKQIRGRSLCGRKGQDIYDAVLYSSLTRQKLYLLQGHCTVEPFCFKDIKELRRRCKNMKIAVTCKGCDVMAFTKLQREPDQP